MAYDYTNQNDMFMLSERVRLLPDHQFYHLIPAIFASRILTVGFIGELCVKFISWRRKISMLEAYRLLQTKDQKLFDGMHQVLVHHIAFGKDKYDSKSAGGLCNQEVETLVELLEAIKKDDDNYA